MCLCMSMCAGQRLQLAPLRVCALCDQLVSLERMCALTLTPRGLTVTRARGIVPPGPARRRGARAVRADLDTHRIHVHVPISRVTLIVFFVEERRDSRDTVRERRERQYMVFSYYQQILILPTILNKNVRSE